MRTFTMVILLAGGAVAQVEPKWDVERLFAGTVVVDGCVNYYSSITGSGIGQPDFARDAKGQTIKQRVGVDIGPISLGSEAGLDGQLRAFRDGTFENVVLVRTAADLDRALREKTYGVLFYCQKHFPLQGGVDAIARWYEKGLRIQQLQYSSRDGNQEPGEKLGGGNDQEGGLTGLGRKVVHELIRLRMVIDLSHCNEATILDTVEIARKAGVPVTANHSAARGAKLADGRYRAHYWRNMTDEAMRAIASTGGVVGVMAYGPYLRGPYQKLRRSPPPRSIPHATIDDFVAHVHYMVERIGADHVGISTDGYLDGTMAHERKADGVLDSPRRWKAAAERLHGMGYSDADLRKVLGGNFLRVFRKVLEPGR